MVGLSQTAKLYVNNIQVQSNLKMVLPWGCSLQLATNCSSFYVHDNFLLLTTHWHTLHCISLHQSVSGDPIVAPSNQITCTNRTEIVN